MPATKRERLLLGVLDGLVTEPAPKPATPAGEAWLEGYRCAVNAARSLLRDEIRLDDEDGDDYVAVPGVGGARS